MRNSEKVESFDIIDTWFIFRNILVSLKMARNQVKKLKIPRR